MTEYLLLFKSLHIVGAVAWFGGLFYMVRIFVYHIEALEKTEPERAILIHQYQIMESRVYRIICIPGMLITWVFGSMIMVAYIDAQGLAWLKVNSWLHPKLLFIVLLSGYQHYCKYIIKQLSVEKISMSSFQMILFNEVPTIFLLIIVLLAVYRNTLDSGIAFLGILIFGFALYLFARWYQSKRKS